MKPFTSLLRVGPTGGLIKTASAVIGRRSLI